MIDFATLLQFVGSLAIVVGPPIVLNRWLAGAEGPSLADALAIPVDPPWPHGVQEEEPVRWHVEALLAPHGRAHQVERDYRKAAHPAVGLTTEPGDCRAA